MKINLVGRSGMMGRVHKREFEKLGHEVVCTGRNSSPTPEEAAKTSDITIISVPIHVTEETIKKVAPFCKAIADFTGIKEKAMKTMLDYSQKNCEVVGLHPLYGEVDSIKGRPVILCETEKTGETCRKLVEIFRQAGAILKPMTPKEHDTIVSGIMQNARTVVLEAYAKLLKENNINIGDFYDISSPPAKTIIELIAKQINSQGDELYADMMKFNPYQKQIDEQLQKCLKEISDKGHNSEEIRALFGKDLQKIQENAKKII